jgi:hypothetical protein
MASQHTSVPSGVRLVGILALIVGVVQAVAGIVMLAARDDVDGYTSSQALAVGLALVVVGGVYLLVARGLLNLTPWALLVGLLFSGFKAAFDLVALIGFGIDGLGFSALISLVINVCVFAMLWSGRSAFDHGPEPARA